ncbi:MAG: SDR family oxidoreductase [Chloroflexota bacterium]|nr:SDR family oxidoreductase [Chloroflexota bacterium]
MAHELKGRNAVVTGAGRGIGRAVAIALAAAGARVVVNDPGVAVDGSGTDKAPADEVVSAIRSQGGTAIANYDTVANVEGGENMIKACVDSFGRIDCLVNVAGILRDRMIFNMTEEEWDDVIRVHLKGHFACTKPASVLMRQQRYGRIVNFSSISGLRGNSGQANYGAAKAGIAGFTRVVARDLGRYGVTVNCIAPAAMTRMTATVPQAAGQVRSQRGISAAAATIPRLAEMSPEHIAPMVVYLCSDDAWNINGQIFHVAGGTISLAATETPVRTITKDSKWILDELAMLVPTQLMYGFVNPAPPPDDLDIPGRPARRQE